MKTDRVERIAEAIAGAIKKIPTSTAPEVVAEGTRASRAAARSAVPDFTEEEYSAALHLFIARRLVDASKAGGVPN